MFTPSSAPPRRCLQGFTLIELMIVVAVIAILAVIALPSYQRYILEARRSDGQAALQRIQLAQEKWRTNNNGFTTDFTQLQLSTQANRMLSADGHYEATITASSATGYTATATARGAQAKDVACATMSIVLSSGVSIATTPTECWKQ